MSILLFFVLKQKTAYEILISDWSSDVCSSALYVFAIGGNPEAAELSVIHTRRTQMLVFTLMGLLCGIAACISTARLQSATNAAGTFDELYVIAATVIDGTSLAGGAGTIYGAMLGAIVMGSLQSGMLLDRKSTRLNSSH